ncbi:hypothetical protein CBS14141_000618 [Malassezia furfur]|nr:hypothetical protein CBS14141_000618 [Malassezia furfur]
MREVGTPVDATPSPFPRLESIRGRHITLYPLEEKHDEILFETVGDPVKNDLWSYIPIGPYRTLDEWKQQQKAFREADDQQMYVIVSNQDQSILGTIGIIAIRPKHRVLEIAYVMFSQKMQRTCAGTESVFLLLKTCIDDFHYRRVEWKTNNLNEKSKSAALRYGFTFEGIFRRHYIIRGHNRDTAWFSIIDEDWPKLRVAFEKWLDPSNFDADGKQKHTLAELRPN